MQQVIFGIIKNMFVTHVHTVIPISILVLFFVLLYFSKGLLAMRVFYMPYVWEFRCLCCVVSVNIRPFMLVTSPSLPKSRPA